MVIRRTDLPIVEEEQIFGVATQIDNDYSLHAFLRALQLKANPEISVPDIKLVVSVAEYRDLPFEEHSNGVYIYTQSTFDGLVVPEGLEGWNEFTADPYPLNKYLGAISETRLFNNETKKVVVAFVKTTRLSHMWVQHFESVLFRSAPWLFANDLTLDKKTKRTTPSEKLKEFIVSITYGNGSLDDNKNAMMTFCNEAIKNIDWRSIKIERLFNGYAERTVVRRRSEAESRIKDDEDSIHYHSVEIENLYKRIAEQKLILTENVTTDIDKELQDFFRTHKDIALESVSDDEIMYSVTGWLSDYDDQKLENTFKNRSSSFSTKIPKPGYAYRLFKDHIGLVCTAAIFKIAALRAITPYAERDGSSIQRKYGAICTNAMPHPHIGFHRCLGDNNKWLDEYARRGDWQLAIEQTIGAVHNINFNDSTVVGSMGQYIGQNLDKKMIYVHPDLSEIYKPDAEAILVSYNEFCNMLDKKDAEAKEKQDG